MSSNKSIKNFNRENIYSSSENDSLKESSEILKNNEKILTIDKKRKKDDFSNDKKRDFSATYLILRSVLVILILVIGIYFFNKGIEIYEKKIDLEYKREQTLSPVLQEVTLIQSVDFEKVDDKDSFFNKQILNWKLSESNLIAAKDLDSRGNINEAIKLCHKSLRDNPANLNTLNFLIELYEKNKNYLEAINTIFRLLTTDNDNPDLIVKLINLLYLIEDHQSVIIISDYYNDNYIFNYDINLIRANSLLKIDDIDAAEGLYNRLIIYNKDDLNPINALINIYFIKKDYAKALPLLDKNYEKFHRDENFYYNYALCNAEIGDVKKVCEILSKANKIFGPFMVKNWLNNPVYSKFSEDRFFKIFVQRIDKKIEEIRNSVN